MKDKTIAILENRVGDQMADLVRKYGGTPFSAPALAEIPDIDPAHITGLLDDWDSNPPDIFIFQTGVGVRGLFAATDSLGLTNKLLRLLEAAQVVVRGPKPTAVLRSRNVRIDLAAKEPYTTAEVLAGLDATDLRGKRVVVQRYGETNWKLQSALEDRGTQVIEIATYRWSLPENTGPLIKLMDALERNEIDAVAFTSASQAHNLFTVAKLSGRQESLKNSLNQTVVASIGPACTAALNHLGVRGRYRAASAQARAVCQCHKWTSCQSRRLARRVKEGASRHPPTPLSVKAIVVVQIAGASILLWDTHCWFLHIATRLAG